MDELWGSLQIENKTPEFFERKYSGIKTQNKRKLWET
jgi:hypothetical protein